MARVLRSTKITIAEDPSTNNTPQQHEERRTESRGPLEPIDNVTETVVVSVDEAHEADEEKLLKAAFKSAIGVKKKKKNKKDRRTAKQDSSEQVSADNATPDENAEDSIEADIPNKTPDTDNDKLQHLLKDLQDTHKTAPATVPEPAQDITLIRNVPTEPAAHRRTRSQHNSMRQAQPGQYIQPSNYHYSHGGMAGPSWSRGSGYGQYRPPAPGPYTHHNSHFGGFRGPGIFAGPPPPVLRGGYMNHHDLNWQLDSSNSLEQVQKWLSESTPEISRTIPVANQNWRKVEEQKQEPIYIYTGPGRYVSNSTIEISATAGEESMDDAPGEEAAEVEGETEIEAQVAAQVQQNVKAVEEEAEAPAQAVSEHNIEENEKASVAEVKASTPTESETDLVEDETPAHIEEPEHDEDSFVHHIVERSPAKPARRRSSLDEDLKLRFASRPGSAENFVDNLEKFEDIITRSPAKPVSRIEDSLEKLDMDEDLLEALVEVVSGSARGSPAKGNSPIQSASAIKKVQPVTPATTKAPLRRAATVTARSTPAASTVGLRGGRALVSRMASEKASAGTATVRVRAPVVKPSVMGAGFRRSASVASGSVQSKDSPFATARPVSKRPVSLLPPKAAVKSTKAPTRPSFELPGEKVARELKEKREAREARMAQRDAEAEKAGPVKRAIAPVVRSSKPPTKPSFELPGDALSRKKREEHQAKLKAQEEEERKRREFRARPLRRSITSAAPAPRETAASLARKSIAGAPSELTVGKRSLRPSIAEIDHDNVVHSAPRTRVSSKTFERKTSITTRPSGPSMSGLAMQRTPSNASATGPKKLNGKEIYKRDARALENAEEEKKVKQEAAKKAREAAAERGRQASKEWAEKQKRKMMEGKIADQGLSAGYGPGGQLGLKA